MWGTAESQELHGVAAASRSFRYSVQKLKSWGPKSEFQRAFEWDKNWDIIDRISIELGRATRQALDKCWMRHGHDK